MPNEHWDSGWKSRDKQDSWIGFMENPLLHIYVMKSGKEAIDEIVKDLRNRAANGLIDDKQLVEQLQSEEPSKILNVADVGGGKGGMTKWIRSRPEVKNQMVMDITPNVPISIGISADAKQMPLADKSIDLALCTFAMMHIGKEEFMKELKRVLKDHGQVVLVVHKKDSILHRETSAQLKTMQADLNKVLKHVDPTTNPKIAYWIKLVESLKKTESAFQNWFTNRAQVQGFFEAHGFDARVIPIIQPGEKHNRICAYGIKAKLRRP